MTTDELSEAAAKELEALIRKFYQSGLGTVDVLSVMFAEITDIMKREFPDTQKRQFVLSKMFHVITTPDLLEIPKHPAKVITNVERGSYY